MDDEMVKYASQLKEYAKSINLKLDKDKKVLNKQLINNIENAQSVSLNSIKQESSKLGKIIKISRENFCSRIGKLAIAILLYCVTLILIRLIPA